VIAGCAFFLAVLLPEATTSKTVRSAKRAASEGSLQVSRGLLIAATGKDKLGPAAPALAGRMYLQSFLDDRDGDESLLASAERYLKIAAERNPADFKNYEMLAEVYCLTSQCADVRPAGEHLQKALDAASNAADRYGGCGRLWFKRGRIADRLDLKETAAESYRKAIDAEDAYREQFRIMYPGREMFSRLGEANYRFAKQRLKEGRQRRRRLRTED
jgi:tetratricopeptide (TPR) repeat protein